MSSSTPPTILDLLTRELRAYEAVAELLRQQRKAAIDQDLQRLAEINRQLSEAAEAARRCTADRLRALAGPPPGGNFLQVWESLRRAQHTLHREAELTSEVLAELLAYVEFALDLLGPTASYDQHGRPRPAPGSVINHAA